MNWALICFLGLFVLTLLLGAPTYLALLIGSLSWFMFHPEISAMMIMQKLYGGLDNFVLLAVPLFMMAGSIMNVGSITQRIFDFAKALVGHWKGGLGHVNIVASFIFSGMSGSALADVGGLGQIEIAAMREENYDEDLTLGITAASATMGPIVPPSIPLVVFGASAGVSIGALFLGGLLPGVVMMIIMCITCSVIAHRRNYPAHARATGRERWHAFKRAILSLLMPVIVMGGMWGGYFTPTEASLMSIVYALAILRFVYHEITAKQVLTVIIETAQNLVPALACVVASALFGWILQFERLDKLLISFFTETINNEVILIICLNLLLLFFGMILDATPVIMLMVPMVMPLCEAMGMHPVHLGVMMVLNLMIGLMTPPIGQSLFIMSSTMHLSFEYVVKNTYRWLLPLMIELVIVSFVPPVVTFLPTLLGMM